MVYNWDGKEADCFRLYVEEKKSMDEVIEFWEQRNFTPSKRAFQTQFKRWNFPSKQNLALKNSALIDRVKDLWEANTTQKEMLSTMQNEGFTINDRELTRLRLKYGWMLRDNTSRILKSKQKGASADQNHANAGIGSAENGDDARHSDADSTPKAGQEDPVHGQDSNEVPTEGALQSTIAESEPAPLDPEEALRRQARRQQLQIESAEKWSNRKRRRRTRGWANLPADAPGEPPRFPSETTIDESKAYLGLTNDLYRQIRDQFQALCMEEGIYKKTVAGPEKWGRVKDRLIRENAHLASTFHNDAGSRQQDVSIQGTSNFKALSLDVICMDVTKRMRTFDSRMGIPEAKTILGLNPEETRQIRKAFQDKLRNDHFTNKFEAGEQHWEDLKQAWVQDSPILRDTLSPGPADAKHAEKVKAVEVLARDVMKRFRDFKQRKDPSLKSQLPSGPGPGPAKPSMVPPLSSRRFRPTETADNNDQADAGLSTLSDASALQIDPSLLLAASNPSLMANADASNPTNAPPNQNQYLLSSQFYGGVPLPIYFRLHPHSTTSMPGKMIWLGILQAATVPEIRTLAMREHPGTVVMKIEGLIVHKAPGQADRETLITIDDDDELIAYLQHVAGGKATFVVLLGMGQTGYV
ncbi:hypothetical protein BU24DRAFT_449296 [Aaosphaeria arxii CBS 175.79]|uniref:Uncharacterized protein n=1 Tax=Aaosphaeria arxii CBS 175.79 TaxID=1450172 RepID=A0A6A5XY80_9PLEO|nr:uncharacterized protein BU24DRAFT_449296 [Aaosphaeria arxii CBS 175.79]KAF2017671.1 hypothetical protein BU24DRAFT_449296 [Aaosphaeria arxii CBS 175.79]